VRLSVGWNRRKSFFTAEIAENADKNEIETYSHLTRINTKRLGALGVLGGK
jgi:hypothetical protein